MPRRCTPDIAKKKHKVRRSHFTAIFLVFMSFLSPYAPHTQAAPPYISAASIHIRNPPRIPIPPHWPHARRDRRGIAVGLRRRPPYASVAFRQFTKNCKVRNPTSRRPYTVAHAPQIPMRPGSPYVFAASHAIQRPPTQAISPYGIAVPPYGHTPDASPHTF